MWSSGDYENVFKKIDSLEREMVGMQKNITAIPAISPASGGKGEAEKAALLEKMLKDLRPDVLDVINAPDEKAERGVRPSIVAKWTGEKPDKTLWIMAHTDVVPPGPLDLWDTDPWEVVEKDGKLYGRGVEDNQQALVAGFFAVKAMLECGLKPVCSVGLLFVADEEVGSKFGIDYVLREHASYFNKEDLILVPDTGSPDGSMIEVAEKSILWMKVTVTGKQSHASMPQDGNNAHRAGAHLLVAIDEALHGKYPGTDALFSPPASTFEPTRKLNNVDGINIIPGEDVFHFDCRILPDVNISEVISVFTNEGGKIAERFGVKVDFEPVQKVQAAPSTPVESEVVKRLAAAIKETRGIKGKTQGIGGGTVASFFRNRGFGVAVWGTLEETMHQPNENCRISNMVADSKVFAHMFGQE